MISIKNKKLWFYIIFFVVLFGAFYAFLFAIIDQNKSRLPILNNVNSFSFQRQDNHTITDKDVAGKVYVAEFFFSTCKGICPRLNHNMEKIAEKFRNEKDFLILSHTVDPETDTVGRLKRYSDSLGADIHQWWFLTGPKQDLYRAARESYILDDPQNNSKNINEQFIHTQFFALVDKKGRVRGIYDGLKKDELKKLNGDVEDLLNEK